MYMSIGYTRDARVTPTRYYSVIQHLSENMFRTNLDAKRGENMTNKSPLPANINIQRGQNQSQPIR